MYTVQMYNVNDAGAPSGTVPLLQIHALYIEAEGQSKEGHYCWLIGGEGKALPDPHW